MNQLLQKSANMATPNNPSINENSSITTTITTTTTLTLTSTSYFQTTVRLNDWWLVKADNNFQGKRLAVAGILHREKQALRVFSSAPILKRYDLFNLETADGVWIIINGLINKARTEENGFPSEVFDHFIFGFPPLWEKYALNCFGDEPSPVGAAEDSLNCEKLSPEAGSDSSIKHVETLVLSGNSLDDNIRQPLAESAFEENSVPPSYPDSMCSDKDAKQDQNNEDIRKRASKVMHSPCGLGGVANRRMKSAEAGKKHICQTANFSVKKKSFVTPKKNEETSTVSLETSSLGRSRSGRLLLPSMQFWRNQRAVYDADRRIMGIKDPQPDQSNEGSRSEPRRKKRPLL